MAGGNDSSSNRPPSVKKTGTSASSNAGPSSSNNAAQTATSPQLPATFGAEALFHDMRNSVAEYNAKILARNAALQKMRDEGKTNIPDDEPLKPVMEKAALDAFLASFTSNNAYSTQSSSSTSQIPANQTHAPTHNLGPVAQTPTLVPPSTSATSTDTDDAGSKAGSDIALAAAIQAGGSNLSSVLASINANANANKYVNVDYSKVGPIYKMDDVADNKFELNPTTIPNSILALANYKLPIPLSLLTTKTLRQIRANVGLKTIKITSGNGVGKVVLDVNQFPVEESLTYVDFLQAYKNWLSIINSTADPALALGWYQHYDLMMEEEDGAATFPAWYRADKALRDQWTSSRPAMPDVKDPDYKLIIATFKVQQGRNALPGETLASFENSPNGPAQFFQASSSSSSSGYSSSFRRSHSPSRAARSSDVRYQPYNRDTRDFSKDGRDTSKDSFREFGKDASFRANKTPIGLCARCGEKDSHFARFCKATRQVKGDNILVDWRDRRLIRTNSNKEICLNFNVRTCDLGGRNHPEHSCSFCGHFGHGARGCSRN